MHELLFLACLITSECNICSDEEKMLVGSVVMNRMADPQHRWPTKIDEVIVQRNQFHGYVTNNFYPAIENQIIAAKLIMHGPIRNDIYYFYLRDSPYKKWRSAISIKHKAQYHNFCGDKCKNKN